MLGEDEAAAVDASLVTMLPLPSPSWAILAVSEKTVMTIKLEIASKECGAELVPVKE